MEHWVVGALSGWSIGRWRVGRLEPCMVKVLDGRSSGWLSSGLEKGKAPFRCNSGCIGTGLLSVVPFFSGGFAVFVSLRETPAVRSLGERFRCSVLGRGFPCSLFSVPCSLFSVPCSLFPVPCSLFSVPCSLFPVLCSLFSVPCSLFSVLCSLFSVLCSLFSVPCSLFSVRLVKGFGGSTFGRFCFSQKASPAGSLSLKSSGGSSCGSALRNGVLCYPILGGVPDCRAFWGFLCCFALLGDVPLFGFWVRFRFRRNSLPFSFWRGEGYIFGHMPGTFSGSPRRSP